MDLLAGPIQPYAWGDPAFIAQLQGRVPTGDPEAELWLGDHPLAPSQLVSCGRSLPEVVTADPELWLGPDLASGPPRLPFLLKVLAAGQPLSIQAHPTRAQARAGFSREEAAGLAWHDPRRMYRDTNHKPELLVALTRFEGKCGFRPLAATRALMALLVAAGADHLGAELARRLDRDDSRRDDAAILAQVLSWLLGGIGSAGPDLVAELVTASEKVLATGLRTVPTFVPSGTESPYGSPEPVPAFEAELRWTPELDRCHPGDIGVAMALLLNHVVLEPGQGLFLGAGNLHAYLRGAGVEIMANGDNVIRGGLTAKHVDGAELAAIVDTTPGSAPIQTARDGCHRFDAPTPDFSLTRLQGPSACRLDPQGPEIVLVTAGRAELTGSTGPAFTVGPGQAAVVAAADGPYRIDAGPGTVAWRAAVGDARALSASSCRV